MKLMLVDDHPLFLEGLQYLLQVHGIDVAGTTGSGEEALKMARELNPDIILMDIRMPGCGGICALKRIKAEMPEAKVVMLTSYDDDKDVFEAVRYGASGYLLKSIDADALINTLNDIASGGTALTPGLAGRILTEFKSTDGAARKAGSSGSAQTPALTERQTEILKLVAEGTTYKDVADRLGLSERTVKYHMGRIIELLHMKNRAQAIGYAVQTGIAEK